jgi:hypothetical protein
LWYRESEWEISFLPLNLGFGIGRETGSEEVISTSACGVLEMGAKMDYKQFYQCICTKDGGTSASCSRDSGKSGSEEVLFTSASVRDKEEKLNQKHVFTSASWGKTGSEEVIFTCASLLGMEEKLDQKQFALFIRTLKMIYEFYQVKF